MGIILDIKNSIRDAIYNKDKSINFFFNKIETVKYPYVFLYFPTFSIDSGFNDYNYSKITLNCVLEYMKSADNSHIELWDYLETLSVAMNNIPFLDTILNARDVESRLVDDVLQMTFYLDIYYKYKDENELMEELDFEIKGV